MPVEEIDLFLSVLHDIVTVGKIITPNDVPCTIQEVQDQKEQEKLI